MGTDDRRGGPWERTREGRARFRLCLLKGQEGGGEGGL